MSTTNSDQKQSLSRLAHRYIQDAYTKANRLLQFERAHSQAQLSDRVWDNKWYSRWWRSFTKFFGGQHDQKINQSAFGRDINTKSPSHKRKAMKIQKIYGFIKLMSKLPGLNTYPDKEGSLPKWIQLQDFVDGDTIDYYGPDIGGSFYIFIASPIVVIILLVPDKDAISKITPNQLTGKKQVDISDAHLVQKYRLPFPLRNGSVEIVNERGLPALSAYDVKSILDNPENDNVVNKIYNHIISYAKSFQPPQLTEI